MTARDPGASDVLTHGAHDSPRATALRASMPAASITTGFEVFVQEVIAASTTDPCASDAEAPPCAGVGDRPADAVPGDAAVIANPSSAIGRGNLR